MKLNTECNHSCILMHLSVLQVIACVSLKQMPARKRNLLLNYFGKVLYLDGLGIEFCESHNTVLNGREPLCTINLRLSGKIISIISSNNWVPLIEYCYCIYRGPFSYMRTVIKMKAVVSSNLAPQGPFVTLLKR